MHRQGQSSVNDSSGRRLQWGAIVVSLWSIVWSRAFMDISYLMAAWLDKIDSWAQQMDRAWLNLIVCMVVGSWIRLSASWVQYLMPPARRLPGSWRWNSKSWLKVWQHPACGRINTLVHCDDDGNSGCKDTREPRVCSAALGCSHNGRSVEARA